MKRLVLNLAAWSARYLPMSVKKAIYRYSALAGIIRTGLNRAAPQGPAQVEIAAGPLAGATMVLDLQLEKDYWLGTYEAELQAAVKQLVAPGMVAYDVGANIGYITLLLARQCAERGMVFAFEALPANIERLRQHVRLNQLDERITVVPGAVADRVGSIEFLVGVSNQTGKAAGSAGRATRDQGTLVVPAVSLDAFVYQDGAPAPQVVKVDIEGGEVLALPGMRRVLAEARPILLLELHGPEAAQVAWQELTSVGYTITRMGSGFPRVSSLQELDWKAYLVAFPPSKPYEGRRDG